MQTNQFWVYMPARPAPYLTRQPSISPALIIHGQNQTTRDSPYIPLPIALFNPASPKLFTLP